MASRRILMLLSKSTRHDGRVLREARALLDAGHRVRVLEWARQEPTATADEVVNGVRVHRVRHSPALAALRDPLLQMPLWWRHGTAAARRLHREWAFDVVHAHDLDTLPIGVRLRRRLPVRLVFDAHERYPLLVRHRSHLLGRLAAQFEDRLLRQVDALITCGDQFYDHYTQRVAPRPVAMVRNSFWDNADADAVRGRVPRMDAGYYGTLTGDRLWPQLAESAADRDDITVAVAGKREGCFDEVAAIARDHPDGGLRFLGTIAAGDMLAATADLRVVLCPLDPASPQFRVQVANKVYDAMAAGRPVVAIAGTASGDFVTRHAMGVTCQYDAADMLAAAAGLARDPERAAALGSAGHAVWQEQFQWPRQAQHLQDLYAGLGGPGGP